MCAMFLEVTFWGIRKGASAAAETEEFGFMGWN
jgi:hypothetical protein